MYYEGLYTGELVLPPRLVPACDWTDNGCPVNVGDNVGFGFTIGLTGLTRSGDLFLEIGIQCSNGQWMMCARIHFFVIIARSGNQLFIPMK